MGLGYTIGYVGEGGSWKFVTSYLKGGPGNCDEM